VTNLTIERAVGGIDCVPLGPSLAGQPLSACFPGPFTSLTALHLMQGQPSFARIPGQL
jgi:hypothetical protein